MIKVLAIGNSFSQDATRYLYRIANEAGEELKVVNLYIGGCPLLRHYNNLFNDAKDYVLEYNGENTEIKVSLSQVLKSADWDVVTLQQVSHESVDYETYQPYLNTLAEHVRFHLPNARLMIHQTWAYEQGSARLCDELGYSEQGDMFKDIKRAYKKAASDINAELIPCGEAFQKLIKNGILKVHRDTFHASLGIGRYTLGCVWFEAITGKSCIGNSFAELDEQVTEEEIKVAQECANMAVAEYKRDC